MHAQCMHIHQAKVVTTMSHSPEAGWTETFKPVYNTDSAIKHHLNLPCIVKTKSLCGQERMLERRGKGGGGGIGGGG